LPVVAEVLLTAQAEEALTAVDSGVERNPLTWLEARHRATRGFHQTSGFMTHHQWRNAPASAAIVAVYITTADAAGLYTNQQIIRANLRLGEVGQFEVFILTEQESVHSLLVSVYSLVSNRRVSPIGSENRTGNIAGSFRAEEHDRISDLFQVGAPA